ncbi:MAG: hypothetical protein ACREC3_15145 [Methyloceanibacter sp.]
MALSVLRISPGRSASFCPRCDRAILREGALPSVARFQLLNWVLALYDDLVREGTVIREEADGFKVLLDLQKRDRAEAVAALEAILARL